MAITLLAALALSGCSRKEILIYTSLPKSVIAEMEPLLRAAVSQAEVKWFQGTDDQIAVRYKEEDRAKKKTADILFSGDPIWFLELKKQDKLLPFNGTTANEVPEAYRDPERFFAAGQISVLAIGYSTDAFKAQELPEKWMDLTRPRFNGKLSMGSPLDSGPFFAATFFLSQRYGWDYFARLRAQGLVAQGNSAGVAARLETRERPLGIVALDALIEARSRGVSVRAVYPLDGSIPIPNPVAITRNSSHPKVAQKVFDWFFTPAAQNAIIHGGAYSPLPKMVSPDLARSWNELKMNLVPWSPQALEEMYGAREQIRAKFSEVVLH